MKLYLLTSLVCTTFFTGSLYAASVVEISTKFKINAGSALNLSKGQKVCAVDDAGTRIVCGSTVRVKKKSSTVFVDSKADLSKITKGTMVKLEKDGALTDIGDPNANKITVRKLYKKFTIDAGSEMSLLKSEKICAFDTEGNQLACGKITKAKEKKSYVKAAGTEDLSKLTIGAMVKVERNGELMEIKAPTEQLGEALSKPALVSKLFSKLRIKINAGLVQGLNKKDEICIFNEENVSVACGLIYRVKPTYSYARIKNAAEFPKIKVNMTVRIKKGDEFEDINLNGAANLVKGVAKQGSFMFRLGYAPGLLSPYSYQALEYPATEFAANSPTAIAHLGLQTNFEYRFSDSMSLSLGLRYRSVPLDQVKTGNSSIFQENDTIASEFSLLIDSYLYTLNFGSLDIRFGTGIDLNTSIIDFTATEEDVSAGTSTETYSAASTLSLLALRALVDTRYHLGAFNLGFGLEFEIPLAELSRSITTTTEDEALNTSFEEVLEHDLSGFSLGLVIDAGISF